MRARLLLVVCLVIALAGPTLELASYAKAICERKPIHTTAKKTDGDNGFRIIVEGTPSPDKYRPGETYKVTINGTLPEQRLLGFMLVAVAPNETEETRTVGDFESRADSHARNLMSDGTCDHAVMSHYYLVNKNGVHMYWTAPPQGFPPKAQDEDSAANDSSPLPQPKSRCVEFRATVIEYSDIWYKDEGALTKVICEETATQRDEAKPLAADAVAPPVAQATEEDECCACGHAMYAVTFQGLWSRHTHPRGFPDSKFNYLLHWSNVVGATHGNDYRIWDYGQHASKAVKEVCEFGSSRALENDMKDNSEKIRTVIKTQPLWGVEKITSSVNAVFTVNKKKHLLSLLTMIGPSPDWCVGVSAVDLCTRNCSWADSLDIDLYPWDAGTDSGITYMSANVATEPAEPITRITNTYPNNRESPFYGRSTVRPLARLTLRKNKEACSDDDGVSSSAESSPSTDELVSMMKRKMMMRKKMEQEKCATSQWSDWSECSDPCGTGMRSRRRMLKNPGILPSMCDVELMEKETCIGSCANQRKKIKDDFEFRHSGEVDMSDHCSVTPWSDWSPCSATCGLGMKERWRMFLRKSHASVDCGIHLMEKDLCRGEIYDCNKAMMMKNFSAICTQEADVGPCRGMFPRWTYNASMEKCQVFNYGGCRGNENRFDSEEECVDLCAEHMADVQRQQQMMEKKRMMEQQLLQQQQQQQENEQSPTEDEIKAAMMKKQQMMAAAQNATQEAPSETEDMGDEDEDEDVDAEEKKMMKLQRKRERLARKKEKIERRRRRRERLLRQKQNDARGGPDCMVTPWSDWSECSVSCGKGFMTKQRGIKVEAQSGGRPCPKRLMKKKKCKRRKCPVDCEMGPWSEWTSCSATCGDKSVQVRKRKILQKPKRGGMLCQAKREKRFCNLPMCPHTNMEQNMQRFMMFHRRY